VAAYCRVSGVDQKDDLERQVGRVVAGAIGLGLAVGQVVSEVGSSMNGHRRKLTKLLSDPAVTIIVVEHRDRITRFGFEPRPGTWNVMPGRPGSRSTGRRRR
jgi:putative resolvase